tara:strand:+ start:188 stop:337 length:150 start_codon:yes stop_codon:yes gene_type:complete
MDERFISNGIESDNLNMNVQEQDYKNLLIRLKEISSIISSLEQKYLDKF